MRTFLLLLLLAPASWAQAPSPETGLEGTTPLTTDDATLTPPSEPDLTNPAVATPEPVSEAMLSSFVKSLLEIQPLLEEASTALLATESETERQEIEQSFEDQAIAIIDTNAISVADYRRLITLANSDETFTQRVAAEIDRLQALASPAPEASVDAATPSASPTAAPTP